MPSSLLDDMFTTCSKFIQDLFIICLQVAHFITRSWLFITISLFLHFFCNFINSLKLPHLHYFISFTSLNSNASLEMLYFIYLTWTTHFIQNTSFELLQVGAELGRSAPTCLSFLSQCFLQKGFSHHKTYFSKSNFAPPHQTLAISWSCYLLRWCIRKDHYSVSSFASSFIRNIHM